MLTRLLVGGRCSPSGLGEPTLGLGLNIGFGRYLGLGHGRCLCLCELPHWSYLSVCEQCREETWTSPDHSSNSGLLLRFQPLLSTKEEAPHRLTLSRGEVDQWNPRSTTFWAFLPPQVGLVLLCVGTPSYYSGLKNCDDGQHDSLNILFRYFDCVDK